SQTASDIFLRGLKRAALIFLLGYVLSWLPFFREIDGEWVFKPLATTRIFGVLQRIGFCYALALPFIYYLSPKKLLYASAVMLLGYWGLLGLFGDLSLEGNAVLKLDLLTLGASHLYMGEGIPFEPEGLLSNIPSMVNIFGGYLVGLYLRDSNIQYEKLAKLMLAGTALLFIAYIWHPTFPINKKIWTSSFVLLTVGLDCLILGLVIFFMEFSPKKYNFRIFTTFGKNPLFIYVLSGLIAKTLGMVKVGGTSLSRHLYHYGFEWIGGHLGSLSYALFITFICWLVARELEKRSLYIKI
ncbi:MAG: DUF5009 domain-containing protein, partial [Cyclobacteriaceae bacterium]|nr:DUF5009 domain-containing protein [Cyclobacteriaceae bacterium]